MGQVATRGPIAELAVFMRDNRDTIAEALPEGVSVDLVCNSLRIAIESNTDLAKCTPASLKRCLREMMLTGLEVGSGFRAKAYIIPYGNEAQFQPSYKGIKELVKRSGKGELILGAVREGDHFEAYGEHERPVHQYDMTDKTRHTKPVTYAYAYYSPFSAAGGSVRTSVWPVERCIAHRDKYSQGWRKAKDKKNHAWHPDNPEFEVMCMKCPAFYLANRGDLPLEYDVQQVVVSSELSGAAEVVEPERVEHRPTPVGQLAHDPDPDDEHADDEPEPEPPKDREPTDDEIEAAAKECDTPEQCEELRQYYCGRVAHDRIGFVGMVFDARAKDLQGAEA